ncbi:PREDICTED: F-box/kelch-repeat protein At3g23880-like [Fragaria vesca subsp. vesca]|uniref:F-box/kelch-repeat protein At3g23880-like n=1 Tax=Fragaria vesca subsp. vesca TaxID=101020 RepID=UPI0002C32E2B|nr:PREDICTED: F-box/kelch-repeat protein At3g23880-like [Fragaria vesca subsp. vesca]
MSDLSFLLPLEITTDIMLRLPIKSIVTCASVCKSWNSLIKSSAFTENHLHCTIQSYRRKDVHILLLRERKEIYSLYRNNPSALGSDQYVELPYPSKFVFPELHYLSEYHIVSGTCNWLVCLAFGYDISMQEYPIIIWNPTVRKFVLLPRPSFIWDSYFDQSGGYHCRVKWPRQTHAFGHDSRSNDYKVLRIVSGLEEEPAVRVEVYSLARGSWRPLDVAVPACFKPQCISSFINGASHWIQTLDKVGKRRDQDDDEYVIVLFNMETELFGEMQMPEALRKYKPRTSYIISKYEECLALIETGRQRELNVLQVWVMKEYGVVESWTRLYKISGLVSIPLDPFGFKSSCELVLSMQLGRLNPLQTVNFENGEVKDFVIDEHHTSTRLPQPLRPGYDSVKSYFVESLVLFDHPSATSYF